ncbi:hypothetical protein V4B17_02560 [Bartonella sp. B23]
MNRCKNISEDIADFYLKAGEQQRFDGIIPHNFIKQCPCNA